MKRLSKERIKELASGKNVDPEPVWNFVGTIPTGSTLVDNLMNLKMDYNLYGWNYETGKAIRDGIRETFNQ